MPEARTQRRLAAILSADAVGYSRLMSVDETATIRTLKGHRAAIGAQIRRLGGRVVDSPGDNLLAEFPSVVDAVRCAVEVQGELASRNAALPAERRMPFRIGVNLGELVVDGTAIYGDGVNVAARMEGLAEPGGVCVSGTVHEQVRNKLELAYEFLGHREVKNVAEPIPVYRVKVDEAPAVLAPGEPAARAGGWRALVGASSWRLPITLVALVASVAIVLGGYLLRERSHEVGERASQPVTLAVLPFHVLNRRDEIEHLGLGIPDALITRLTNVPRLRVRPTQAILPYEHREVDLQAVGTTLRAEHLLSGTVQGAGGRFRVGVQLVRVGDATPLWAQRFDVGERDLLRLQDVIAEEVTRALEIQLTALEQDRIYRRYTSNAEAFALYLRGRVEQVRHTRDATLAAVSAFEKALRLDPEYALGHAGLATASAQMGIRFAPSGEVGEWQQRAASEARRALELEPDLAEAHEAMAAVHRNTEFDWERTIEESSRAIELKPGLDQPHLYRAAAFVHLGLQARAEADVHAAIEINPVNRVEPLRLLGTSALFGAKFADAASALEEAKLLSEAAVADWYLAQAYFYLGDPKRAESMLSRLAGGAQVEQRSRATLAAFLAARGDRTSAEQMLQQVIANEYRDHHVAYALGTAYAQLGSPAEAVHWLRVAVDTGFPCQPWYEQDPLLRPLREDAEFQRLLRDLRESWRAARTRYAEAR